MRILVVHNVEPEDESFNAPLLAGLSRFATVESKSYRQIPHIDVLTARYDGIVISGVPVTYDFDVIDSRLAYLSWVKTITIPVLGICLGHQNIGRMYGAQVIANNEAEDGMCALRIVKRDPLLKGIESGDMIAAHHRGSISLPDDFALLASTANCRNHMMKHSQRDIYSVQFHAELSEVGIKILGNFIGILQARKA